MDEATQLLQKINTIVERYEAQKRTNASDFNIFSITGIHYKELPICSFLRELLDPRGSHMQGILFLKTFTLQVLKQNHFTNEDFAKARVYKEVHIDKNRRIDILIRISGRLFPIEVKIYAGDQESQLVDYHNYTSKSDSKSVIYYLTLNEQEPSEKSKSNLIKGNQYECISFENDIANWLKRIVENEQIRSVPRLYVVLTQFLDVIHNLTDQMEESRFMEFNNLIKTSKDFHAVLELEKALIDIKCQKLIAVFSAIEERLKARIPELKLVYKADHKDFLDYYKKGNNTWPGICYLLSEKKNKPIGKEFGLYIELGSKLYYGICNCNVVKTGNIPGKDKDSKKYVFDNSRRKENEVKSSKTSYWWEYLPEGMQVNYRRPNKEYEALFDEDNFNDYIDMICNKIEAFMDIWNETGKRNEDVGE